MREALADLAHSMWSGWMTWMFAKGEFNKDGSWTMPKESVERWTRQATTSYRELPENEKKSDRTEADKMIKIFKAQGG